MNVLLPPLLCFSLGCLIFYFEKKRSVRIASSVFLLATLVLLEFYAMGKTGIGPAQAILTLLSRWGVRE